jgi:hypothetical protein
VGDSTVDCCGQDVAEESINVAFHKRFVRLSCKVALGLGILYGRLLGPNTPSGLNTEDRGRPTRRLECMAFDDRRARLGDARS